MATKQQVQARQETQPQPTEQQVAPAAGERTRPRPVYVPRTDIYETDTGLVLLVDMPGVRSDSCDLSLERNVLTIRGRIDDMAPQGFSPVYREYEPGDFERVFTLSEDVDAGAIEAQAKDGVFRLFLPKAGPAQTKRIQIKAG
ncbi:MAG TPA: Hsp20/alpha crystallin family protein [Geminicoccaceae bacterium]|jgi:HSP20 family protein|nr:Hsp20/alpha crystallin family protein [Geminicoccaceae bacterium]